MKMAEKAVFRKEVMEAVDDAPEDKTREDAGGFLQEQEAKLVEQWAYGEGFRNGVRRVERE